MRKSAIGVSRAENFADWYQAVVRDADMAEHSGVRGCMIIKPWGYAVWERLQRRLDDLIRATGHDNCYFPMFIPIESMQREAEHISGFAKEMAVVTHHRLVERDGKLVPDGLLESPLVVRPTSELAFGDAMARWVKSYRDLPLKLNQWANVVRWEMRPRLFLRTAEFLWQEGHTAHASAEEAMEEVRTMLEVYRKVVGEDMRIPVIPGEKTPGERFPGAVATHTIEAMMQDGKALQAGTSHFLGQNFARAAGIQFQAQDGTVQHAFTTSWGVSTRLIGALIMTHGDDDGLRLPTRLAPHHVAILPLLRDAGQRQEVLQAAHALAARIRALSPGGDPLGAIVDEREDSPGNKRWNWVRRGIPFVCELGAREVASGTVSVIRRDDVDTRRQMPVDEFVASLGAELAAYDQGLYEAALANRAKRTTRDPRTFEDLTAWFQGEDRTGFVIGKWSGEPGIEERLGELGLSIRCIPYDQSGTEGPCLVTGKPARTDVIYAKAY